ncbi:conserved hypothetical protein [metagenome]|uniref:Sulfotransferase family protein n=1 Tax=metagenome TaxID=256318 RepID=A0A2P2CH86_9ZZZZ
MTRVVHLHIGAPKTGTTYVQDRLSLNVDQLAKHGVSYPSRALGDASTFHFRAALDLLGQDWGGSPGHADGAWEAMVRKVRRQRGKVVISHEILAPAPADKVAKVMRDLRGSEVHLVYSVRDLGRQLPAAWQESIKQGRKWSFGRFLDRTEGGNAWFARAFDLPSVLDTWGSDLPPERIHVVTVPRRNSKDPDLLWRRFCQALDLDPAWAPLDSSKSNHSLGTAETQLIRRLNKKIGRGPRNEANFDDLVLRILAREELSGKRRSPKVTLPPDRFDWAEEQGRLWIAWLASRGVDVIGDAAELMPRRPDPDATWSDPDRVRSRPLLRASLDALEVMTREAASRPDPFLRRARRKLGRDQP